jgi:hypothetical protein
MRRHAVIACWIVLSRKGSPVPDCAMPKLAQRLSLDHATLVHPSTLSTRLVDAGCFKSRSAGRRGRTTNSPPQFGHRPRRSPVAHFTQKVHSNEQMRASGESGGRSLSQHSQLGRISSMDLPPDRNTLASHLRGRSCRSLPLPVASVATRCAAYYPAEARAKQMRGYCVVHTTVGSTGSALNASITHLLL